MSEEQVLNIGQWISKSERFEQSLRGNCGFQKRGQRSVKV